MRRLLATLVAGYAALALSGAGLAEDRSTRTEPRQEQNQDDHVGPAAVETDSQGDQATADADDQDEQAAIDADDEDTVVILVPDDQNEETAAAADDQDAADQDQDQQAATDADEDVTVVIVVPEDQDQAASAETQATAPASQEDQLTAQDETSQPTRNDSNANAAGVAQDAAIAAPDYSAELKKCDWAQGKRRTHCIETTKKKFGQM